MKLCFGLALILAALLVTFDMTLGDIGAVGLLLAMSVGAIGGYLAAKDVDLYSVERGEKR